jgi:hypothetical protein
MTLFQCSYNGEGIRFHLIGGKINIVIFDISKIKHFVPEFECKVYWAEDIRHTIAWFKVDPARQTIDDDANQLWDRIIASYEKAYPKH